jgi:ectoine hydroxylase-related dioxygenase (phytanoyl-CoA dioxygenase family)
MKRNKVRLYLRREERDLVTWPMLAERFVNDVAAAEVASGGTSPERFIARKGDVLIWHGRLMHRGSYANVPGMERKALISHYSGLSHRVDMPLVDRTAGGQAYFRLDYPLDFDPYDIF